MAPSSPPEKRTFHLLKTPDILLANDNPLPGSYWLINIPNAFERIARIDEFTRSHSSLKIF